MPTFSPAGRDCRMVAKVCDILRQIESLSGPEEIDAMPSFDITCEANAVELKNAVDTANKEIANRFDFKGSDARFELKEKEHEITAFADDDVQARPGARRAAWPRWPSAAWTRASSSSRTPRRSAATR